MYNKTFSKWIKVYCKQSTPFIDPFSQQNSEYRPFLYFLHATRTSPLTYPMIMIR